MTPSSSVKIQVNKIIPGYEIGKVYEVPTDAEGTPLEFFWRRKLDDARIDNCCEIVEDQPSIVSAQMDVADEQGDES